MKLQGTNNAKKIENSESNKAECQSRKPKRQGKSGRGLSLQLLTKRDIISKNHKPTNGCVVRSGGFNLNIGVDADS